MPAHKKPWEGVMAKLKKKTTGTGSSSKAGANKHNAAEVQAKAEQMARSLRDSAQQIWMAGVGAFTRAQGEGSKLFEALVKEGMRPPSMPSVGIHCGSAWRIFLISVNR